MSDLGKALSVSASKESSRTMFSISVTDSISWGRACIHVPHINDSNNNRIIIVVVGVGGNSGNEESMNESVVNIVGHDCNDVITDWMLGMGKCKCVYNGLMF